MFRLGCLASDLPQGVSHSRAAELISEHVRKHRGYALSIGGYHTSLSGWLSAVYWDVAGIFAIHADRGSGTNKPALDVLLRAMQNGLIKPSHPAMLDPQQYVTHDVYLSVVPPPTPTTMAALLTSPHVSTSWKAGNCRVTLAEFLPISQSRAPTPATATNPTNAAAATPTNTATNPAAPAAPCVSPSASQPPSPSKVAGERCAVCGEVVGERWLFTTKYIGCRCG